MVARAVAVVLVCGCRARIREHTSRSVGGPASTSPSDSPCCSGLVGRSSTERAVSRGLRAVGDLSWIARSRDVTNKSASSEGREQLGPGPHGTSGAEASGPVRRGRAGAIVEAVEVPDGPVMDDVGGERPDTTGAVRILAGCPSGGRGVSPARHWESHSGRTERREDWAEIRRLHRAEGMPIKAIESPRRVRRPWGAPGSAESGRSRWL